MKKLITYLINIPDQSIHSFTLDEASQFLTAIQDIESTADDALNLFKAYKSNATILQLVKLIKKHAHKRIAPGEHALQNLAYHCKFFTPQLQIVPDIEIDRKQIIDLLHTSAQFYREYINHAKELGLKKNSVENHLMELNITKQAPASCF